MDTIELKSFRTEIKAKSDFEFEGYASIFNNIDDGGDIMQAGAFSKTLRENIQRIKVLYMHNFAQVIGLPKTLFEDQKGLYFEAEVSNTTLGRDVMTLIKDKVITDMSIGYNPVKWSWDENMDTRTLQEVRLWEISPVTWGMNSLAGISKSFAMQKEYDTIKSELKRLEALILGAGLPTPTKKAADSNELNPEQLSSLIGVLNNL